MTPIRWLQAGLALVLMLAACAAPATPSPTAAVATVPLATNTVAAPPASASKARAIHESAVIVDTHVDTPLRMLDEGFDLATPKPPGSGHLDLPRARAGNLGAAFFSICSSV